MASKHPAAQQADDPLQQAKTWNVLSTAWLEVSDLKGQFLTLSPLEALQRSPELRLIAAASPLDLFAAHRFLLTLLYWKASAGGGIDQTRAAMLAGGIPEPTLSAIAAESGRFKLFDQRAPFLQDPKVVNAKHSAAAYLFAEMSSGTNIAHFDHGDDAASRLCLRCAAQGLLRLVPWSQSGGSGMKPAIHGAPPIMPLAFGTTLCQTLGLNLVAQEGPKGTPQWSGSFTPTAKIAAIPLMEGLTWNPRRVHLLDPHPPSLCSRCGATSEPTVGPICFEKNDACKPAEGQSQNWRDPAAFYNSKAERTIKTGKEERAASGDDIRPLFLQKFGKKVEPAPSSEVVEKNATLERWLVVFPCTNPANNKSYDHRIEMLEGFAGDAPARAVGWEDSAIWMAGDPRTADPLKLIDCRSSSGSRAFVRAAANLRHGDWRLLADSANRSMEEDTAAFDLFTAIYWPLRGRHTTLPSRQAAWMGLKLMASAGKSRPIPGSYGAADSKPWLKLKSQQPRSKAKRGGDVAYPRRIPVGDALETELRQVIQRFEPTSASAKIDWPGLCQFLNEVLP